MKKILAMCMCCVMLLSLCIVSASALETDTVATIGTTEYASVSAAIEAASAADTATATTVKLEKDCAITSISSSVNEYGNGWVELSAGNIVLELNGCTLTGDVWAVASGVKLTIKDSVGGGKITSNGTAVSCKDGAIVTLLSGTIEGKDNSDDSACTASAQAGGIFNVNGGTITATGTGCAIMAQGTLAQLNITDGTITATGNFAVGGNGSNNDANKDTQIVISGGTITGTDCGIYHPQKGALTVSGGAISGKSGIVMRGGTLNVSGGTITATATGTVSVGDNPTTATNAAIVKDTAANYYDAANMNVSLTGGTFSDNLSAFAATGYAVVPVSGVYTVKKTVTDLTIDDAIAPVTNGTPVTSLTADEYTVSIAWEGNPTKFAAATDYTATITLTAKDGYTFSGAGELTVTDMKAQVGGSGSDSTRVVEASFATTANDVTLPAETVTDAIEEGKTSGEVKLDVADVENLTSVSVPTDMIAAALENDSIDKVTVELPDAAVTLDAAALVVLSDAESVVLNVTPVAAEALTTEQVKALGDKADSAIVLDITLLVDGQAQSTFNGGKLTISVPYTPKAGEDTSKLTVWYIKDDGTVENMGGTYDKTTGCFVFETTHLSEYALISTAATPVKTGDSSSTMLWVALSVLCAAAFVVVGVSGVKRYHGKRVQ